MKTKEQELDLLGLQEMNASEKNEVEGGLAFPISTIFNPDDIIICCHDIPPFWETRPIYF